MLRKNKGRLAESKVISYLIENEYEVYTPFSDNSKYDVIGFKDGIIFRISVKYTSIRKPSGSWSVELRQISRRKKSIHIDKFDNSQFDLVAVYIGPIDKVVLVKADTVKTRSLHVKFDFGEVA